MEKKYVFDPEKLSYVEYRLTSKNVILRTFSRFMLFVAITFSIFLFISSDTSSDLEIEKERLERENEQLRRQQEGVMDTLKILIDKENFLYRRILNIDEESTSQTLTEVYNDYNSLLKMSYTAEGYLRGVPTGNPISQMDLKRITSLFGMRLHPKSGVPQRHDGIDLVTEYGAAVKASGAGVVVMTVKSGLGYGNRVVIDHGNGYKTLYAHLSKIDVSVGDSVNRGDKIGEVGSTGLSTGTHLHFEIEKDGGYIDPLSLITLF